MDDEKWNGYIKFEKYGYGYDKVIKIYREILMGRETNKIKEYNKDELIFEGEKKNGKRWNGKGKEYNDDNVLIYDGEYLNGQRHGQGNLYYYEKYYTNKEVVIYYIKFEREFNEGKEWNGKGRKGNYEGEFFHGERKGRGKEYLNSIIFEGEYQKGLRNEKGKEYYDIPKGQLKFEGEFLNGKNWNGKGYNINGEISF